MKSKLIDTIASNEEDVRFRIFSGDLPIGDAGQELLRMERAQRESERHFADARLEDYRAKLNELAAENAALRARMNA